jgi:hypothetical protein
VETYTLTLRDLEAKVKFLRSAVKKMERSQAKYGTAQDFAEWLPYFAEAIGCDGRTGNNGTRLPEREPFVIEGSENWREITGQRYKTLSADGVRRYLDELLKPFQPVTEPATEDA